MSVELLNEIQKAEAEAERLHAEAARQGRDEIKAVEEAISIENRQTAAEIRDAAQRVIAEAGEQARAEIRALEADRSARRAAVKQAAGQKVHAVGQAIFERIVMHGNR